MIGGWTVRYAVEAFTVGFAEDPGAHFGAISEGHGSLLMQLLFMAVTILVVSGGIGAGIERVARIAMPALVGAAD